MKTKRFISSYNVGTGADQEKRWRLCERVEGRRSRTAGTATSEHQASLWLNGESLDVVMATVRTVGEVPIRKAVRAALKDLKPTAGPLWGTRIIDDLADICGTADDLRMISSALNDAAMQIDGGLLQLMTSRRPARNCGRGRRGTI